MLYYKVMTKIVVASPLAFLPEHQDRLERLGEVTYFSDRAKTSEEWLSRVQGYDVICSGYYGVSSSWDKLRDVFVSLPFVNVAWADPQVLKDHNVTMSNSPGCNRHAVSEWVIAMMIIMARRLDEYLNVKELPNAFVPPPEMGLAEKNITILGKGNIGTRVGEIANALEMNVTYFQRNDDLHQKVKDADIIIDVLSVNSDSRGLLNQAFFDSLKKGALFISVSARGIVDIDAMLAALDSGTLAYVAHDAVIPGDTQDSLYQKLLHHPKVYVTPHIAYSSDVERRLGNEMMIENIEAWAKGNPIRVIGEK